MAAMTEDRLDRFARGELSPAEARELAQKSLDNPALFDELTATSLARGGVSQGKRRRSMWLPLVGLAAAAAVVVVLVSPNALRPKPARPASALPTPTAPVFL